MPLRLSSRERTGWREVDVEGRLRLFRCQSEKKVAYNGNGIQIPVHADGRISAPSFSQTHLSSLVTR